MGDRYITPETEILEAKESLVLCLSQPIQSGAVEDVERMEFNW